jgi:FkbM family methyltransferase
MNLRTLVKRSVNAIGIDVIRIHRSPRCTLLGLSNLGFRSIIDVGANEGQFARQISRFFPDARLFCFEPLEKPFQELSAWAKKQKERVSCFQTALGDRTGEGEMHLHVQHTPSSSMLAATDTCHRLYPQSQAERLTRIKISTLDAMLEGVLDSMPRDIMLKLDVQGFEDRVLRGAVRVLAQCRAVVLEVSLDPLYEEQAKFLEIVQLLQEAKFGYAGNLDQVYAEDGRVVYLDAMFLRV